MSKWHLRLRRPQLRRRLYRSLSLSLSLSRSLSLNLSPRPNLNQIPRLKHSRRPNPSQMNPKFPLIQLTRRMT